MKIGIPRGLLFLEFLEPTAVFFKTLGAEVLISKTTNKEIMKQGLTLAIDDICLPVKIFHGHVAALLGKVDYIFVPGLISIYQGENICPKFGGLPELLRSQFNELPLLTVDVDCSQDIDSLKKAALVIGRKLHKDKSRTLYALEKATEVYHNQKDKMLTGRLLHNGLIEGRKYYEKHMNILLLGHAYNLYDSFTNMGLMKHLRDRGARVFTPEMLSDIRLEQYAGMYPGRQYWTFARKFLGLIYYAMEKGDIDGIIFLSSFGCGIDSIMVQIVEGIIRDSEVPFLLLSLDEHSGEAGFLTRIEAFLDMTERRKKLEAVNEDQLSPYGEGLYTS